jgi:hypothetical protein
MSNYLQMNGQNQFWYFLISGQTDDTTGIVGNFYAYGQHCGEALANALQAAAENDFLHHEATEASRLDILEDFEEPDDLIHISDLVLTGSKNYSYPLDTDENTFIPPVGIIKSTEEGNIDYELIKEGFVAYSADDSGLFEFELVADKSRLVSTFIQAIQVLPPPDKSEIHIKGFWGNQQSELWTNESIRTQDDIIQFLENNQVNILENGFVEFAIYVSDTATRLMLDEHKKIGFTTQNLELFNQFGRKMMELGFSQTSELRNLEFGFYHWHYRPADSVEGPEFRLLLLDAGFTFVKKWDEEYFQTAPEQE